MERSRERRQAARRERRRRIRVRGGGVSVLAVVALTAVAGAGAAVGHSTVSGGGGTSAGLLAQGSAGPRVSAVQRALGVGSTGRFDAGTERAVRAFQRRRGLAVDGIVGPQTRAALGLGGGAADGPAGSEAREPAGGQPAGGAPVPSALQSIAQCESGGNPRAVGGGGLYRGKYQFTRGTWAGLGGSGDPAAASEAEQDRRAAMLYARSGASSWPSCGR